MMSKSIHSAVIREVIERLERGGVVSVDDMKGCSEEQIDTVEAQAAGSLPHIYKDFLRVMGRGAGRFYQGTDMFYPTLLELRGWAEELLAEDNADFRLPPDAFVFSMHQGYQFLYFRIGDERSDPPVYHYTEGQQEPIEKWPKFSEFILDSADDYGRTCRSSEG